MAKETDRLISRAGADTGDAYGHIDEKHHEKFKDAASSKERTISPLSPLKFLESTSPHKRGSPPPLHALDPRPPTTQRGRFLLFSTLFMISALLNFDNGAIASSLIPITQEFKLSFSQQGFLGSLVYLGLTISSLFAGTVLQRYDTKTVLTISLTCNVLFDAIFALSTTVPVLMLSRLGIGLSQSFIVIYMPVWVDEFAPAKNRTLWMSIQQASVPLGVMAGYLVSGMVARYSEYTFRVSFVSQVIALIPVTMALYVVPGHYFDIGIRVDSSHTEGSSSPSAHSLHNNKTNPSYINNTFSPFTPGTLTESMALHGDITRSPLSLKGKTDSPAAPPSSSSSSSSSSFSASTLHSRRSKWREEDTKSTNEHTNMQNTGSSTSSTTTPMMASYPSNGSLSTGTPTSSKRPRIDSITASQTEARNGNQSGIQIFVSQVRILAQSNIYICTVWALSSLCFVVTAIQFWVTKYLVQVMHCPLAEVVIGFAVVSSTAPVLGVFFGGSLIDWCGGYRGLKGISRTATITCLFGSLACSCALLTLFATKFFNVLCLIWGLLFWGGAILPPATGILLSSVPPNMRSFSSSVSMLFYNLLGYFAGPFVPGVVAEMTGSLEWGWRLIMMWSVVGVLGMVVGLYYARKDYRAAKLEAVRIYREKKARRNRSKYNTMNSHFSSSSSSSSAAATSSSAVQGSPKGHSQSYQSWDPHLQGLMTGDEQKRHDDVIMSELNSHNGTNHESVGLGEELGSSMYKKQNLSSSSLILASRGLSPFSPSPTPHLASSLSLTNILGNSSNNTTINHDSTTTTTNDITDDNRASERGHLNPYHHHSQIHSQIHSHNSNDKNSKHPASKRALNLKGDSGQLSTSTSTSTSTSNINGDTATDFQARSNPNSSMKESKSGNSSDSSAGLQDDGNNVKQDDVVYEVSRQRMLNNQFLMFPNVMPASEAEEHLNDSDQYSDLDSQSQLVSHVHDE